MTSSLIGLLGGLGPAATVHYYNNLIAECERRGTEPRLLVNHAGLRPVLDAAARDARDELADYLAGFVHELERAGATLLGIAAITPHLCITELRSRIHIPVVDVVDGINAELRRRGIDRVALLGTNMTVSRRLFGRLEATVVDPALDDIRRVHDLYVSIVYDRCVKLETARELGAIATAFARELAVEAVVLAGTELSLVPREAWGGVTVIDSAKLHIDAIVQAAIVHHNERS